MDSEEKGLEFREYIRIIKRRRWLMTAAIVSVVVTALLASLRMTPIYEAKARVEVQPVTVSSRPQQPFEFISMPTQVELMKSDSVLDLARKSLKLPSTGELKEGLEAKLVQDTQIVEVTVRHESPQIASEWANGVAQAYLDFRRDRAIQQLVLTNEELNRQIEEVKGQIAEKEKVFADLKGSAQQLRATRDREAAELASLEAQASAPQASPAPPSQSLLTKIERTRLRIGEIDRKISDYEGGGSGPKTERDSLIARLGVLEAERQDVPKDATIRRGGGTIIAPADIPSNAASPNVPRNMALAVALGIALAIGIAFLAELLDDRLRSPEEVEGRIGAPVLGYVPFVEGWEKADEPFLATVNDPESGASEAFRSLRMNLRYLGLERPIRSLLVTSALREEGKSTTAANLAVVLAQGGSRTTLISADLRRPTLQRLFAVSSPGRLIHALEQELPLESALQTDRVDNLKLLLPESSPPNPTEILASPRFGSVLESLRNSSEYVVIDTPPVLGLADASALASRVDGVLFVVNVGQVSRRALSHAVDQIRKAGGRVLGAVVNAVQPTEGYGYYYQYYYSSYYADGKAREKSDKQSVYEDIRTEP